MSSIHDLARKASFKKLSKQRSDVTGYFPLRRSSQDGPEHLEEVHTTKDTVKATQQSPKNRTPKTPASGGRGSGSPDQGIERLTRLKRSVLNGPQPNLLTNELRKYLNQKVSPGPGTRARTKSRRSASRSRTKSPYRYAIVNGKKTRLTFNTDLPRTPTTAVQSSMLNASHSKGGRRPEKRARKKSGSRPKRYKLLVPRFRPRSPINGVSRRSTSQGRPRPRPSHPYCQTLSRNAGRRHDHSRSVSKVSVRSDNCHTSTRCLSINFPNRAHMGRRVGVMPAGIGQAVLSGATGGARVEQVMLSPPEHSLEQERRQALCKSTKSKKSKKSKNCSSVKGRKRLIAGSKSKSKKRTASKSRQRRIRRGKVVVGGSAPPRRRRQSRVLSTTFGARHMKKLLGDQGLTPKKEAGILATASKAKKRQIQSHSKSKSRKKAKSHGPVTQWMQLMTHGSLKKSNPELKMKKLAKANRKSRSRSREERSKSMKKRRNEKLEKARKNIKARMFEQQQALEKFNGLGMPQQPHLDERSALPYQNLSMDDGLAGAGLNCPESVMAAAVDAQGSRRSGELGDDYGPARLLDTHGAAHNLGSSLGLDGQPYAVPQSFPTATRLRTESSQRTLSVDNYQINEERVSKGPKR